MLRTSSGPPAAKGSAWRRSLVWAHHLAASVVEASRRGADTSIASIAARANDATAPERQGWDLAAPDALVGRRA